MSVLCARPPKGKAWLADYFIGNADKSGQARQLLQKHKDRDSTREDHPSMIRHSIDAVCRTAKTSRPLKIARCHLRTDQTLSAPHRDNAIPVVEHHEHLFLGNLAFY